MRADRLVALVLLLRQRGRMTAAQLARELEVSQRTVLRDIEALSTAGVPVYVDRGRHGGFSLLPGFRTELTGLTHDEALALITAGAAHAERVFGLGAALSSAVRKVIDALPDAHRATVDTATERFLVDPDNDLLSRPTRGDDADPAILRAVRRAVLQGRRLLIEYAPPGSMAREHRVDPLGLVTVRDRTYLLALRDSDDRTYLVTRIQGAEVLEEEAQRPSRTDLQAAWEERRTRFLADTRITVSVRIASHRRDELIAHSRGLISTEGTISEVEAEVEAGDDEILTVEFDDLRHAVWAVWQLDTAAEVLAPPTVRDAVAERVRAIAARYAR
ncbi:MAG TPA: WYL domain-containing protein [Microcella sp.]|nr:WYL domain-containing protein [Microcella sp.]